MDYIYNDLWGNCIEIMSAKKLEKKSKSRVSFAEEDVPAKTRLDVMKEELECMRLHDLAQERRYEEHKQEVGSIHKLIEDNTTSS